MHATDSVLKFPPTYNCAPPLINKAFLNLLGLRQLSSLAMPYGEKIWF